MSDEIHPAVAGVMRFFEYEHLSGRQREISRRFSALADEMLQDFELDGPELTVGLRKLLEAKDCMVRASL